MRTNAVVELRSEFDDEEQTAVEFVPHRTFDRFTRDQCQYNARTLFALYVLIFMVGVLVAVEIVALMARPCV